MGYTLAHLMFSLVGHYYKLCKEHEIPLMTDHFATSLSTLVDQLADHIKDLEPLLGIDPPRQHEPCTQPTNDSATFKTYWRQLRSLHGNPISSPPTHRWWRRAYSAALPFLPLPKSQETKADFIARCRKVIDFADPADKERLLAYLPALKFLS